MVTHLQIWHALDALALRHGTSPSGLAKLAGLDPTTFNKSKRSAANGKLRWPSTESLAKVLTATGASLEDFVALASDDARRGRTRPVPLIGLAQAGHAGYFDDAGFPAGSGWEEIAFPDFADDHAYALEIAGDSMLPVYRDGDLIIASPEAEVRRGDRIVVGTAAGPILLRRVGRQEAEGLYLESPTDNATGSFLKNSEIRWIARVVWASQ